ncbi:hypothetical protein ACOME3_000233 [Neoechinorhynchus agilis]
MEIDGTKMRKSDDGYSDGSDSSPSPVPPRRLRMVSASDRFCRNSKLRHNVFKSPTIDAADANPQITTDSISIPDIVRFLPRNVLKRIPKGARYLVAKAFTGLLNDCLQKNCTPSWTQLFAFPRLVLCTSGDSGVSLTSTIKERLASFEQIFSDFERNIREVDLEDGAQCWKMCAPCIEYWRRRQSQRTNGWVRGRSSRPETRDSGATQPPGQLRLRFKCGR